MQFTAHPAASTLPRPRHDHRSQIAPNVHTARSVSIRLNPSLIGQSAGSRVVSAAGAWSDGGGYDTSYVERERRTNAGVSAIRDEVQQRITRLMEEVAPGSDGLGGGPGPAGGDRAAAAELQRLRSKLKNAVATLQEGLVERDAEVRLMLLAAMAGEHILLIGPPGTAKSEVGRRLNSLIEGKYFERLLTRFSVPEELFGPLSMKALEDDKYIRQTQGYLPDAEVAFIDEIFKANSAILNTLLTIINERLFDNGNQRVPVPLISMVGASNELPESEELDALYDRFLVRRQVKQVSASGVAEMLSYYSSAEGTAAAAASRASSVGSSAHAVHGSMLLTREDIMRCKQAATSRVRVPQSVVQLITDLRTFLQEKNEPPVYVSDRRLVKSVQLLQVAAYCNGRDYVTEYDCLLLQHVLWQRPEQAERIHDFVVNQLSVDDGVKQVQFLLSGLFSRSCRSLQNPDKIRGILEEVEGVTSFLLDKYRQVVQNLNGGFPIVLDNLWLGQEEGEAVATSLEPKLRKTREAVEQVLFDTVMLEVALRNGADPVTLANLMPKYWADFIRNSDIKEVKPFGTVQRSP